MLDRLSYYDVLGMLLPGILVSYWVPICFPVVTNVVAATNFPEAVDVIAFVGIALLIGQLVQASASMLEGFLYWTWGGRPSDYVFERGLGRYLGRDEAQRIRGVLGSCLGERASDRAVFRVAMEHSRIAPNSRVELFNSLYAFHRGLLIALFSGLVIFIASFADGAADSWPATRTITVLVVFVVLVWLVWNRAKQRALYYVAEVLIAAERDHG